MPAKKKNRSFKKVFAQTIKDAADSKHAALMAIARHPRHLFVEHQGVANNPMASWMRADFPWIGAAAWTYPEALEDEMVEAGCGAMFSHGHFELQEDRAFIEHLGPVGSQVSGCQWNPRAFSDQGFSMRVCVATFDLLCRGDRGGHMMEGTERPSYWPEPLPMVRRTWREEDAPENSPDFEAVAICLATQIRAEVLKAILEETDATREQAESILGGARPVPVPGRLARHFARQEHPMFGAAKIEGADLAEAEEALAAARMAMEREAIDRVAGLGRAGAPSPRI